MRIDSHQHFWKFDPIRDSWIVSSMQKIRRDFLPKDLKGILTKNKIDGCVAIQADQSLNETTFLLNHAAKYDFVKGFSDGVLDYQSIQKNDISYSTLLIDNFKVNEVPVLAKILTLASLQGIADLLTGEGIRFTDFEMRYKKNKRLTTIEEIFAIGPAISVLMNGYIEQDKIVSLRGTLVPATTINKTISNIPLLGDILVGEKAGEGVFGVSFKIKGHPNKLKTTVNPIKTLTPRFITRTLKNLKN